MLGARPARSAIGKRRIGKQPIGCHVASKHGIQWGCNGLMSWVSCRDCFCTKLAMIHNVPSR
jgi:hypothetical protein